LLEPIQVKVLKMKNNPFIIKTAYLSIYFNLFQPKSIKIKGYFQFSSAALEIVVDVFVFGDQVQDCRAVAREL